MTIRDYPASDSPKNRLLSKGACALSDAELLSLFIKNASGKSSPVDIAKEALNEFGSLSRVLSVDRRLLRDVNGFGEASYCFIQAAQEITRRKAFETMSQHDVMSSPEHVRHYLSFGDDGLEHEEFGILCLDNRHRVIGEARRSVSALSIALQSIRVRFYSIV